MFSSRSPAQSAGTQLCSFSPFGWPLIYNQWLLIINQTIILTDFKDKGCKKIQIFHLCNRLILKLWLVDDENLIQDSNTGKMVGGCQIGTHSRGIGFNDELSENPVSFPNTVPGAELNNEIIKRQFSRLWLVKRPKCSSLIGWKWKKLILLAGITYTITDNNIINWINKTLDKW